MEQAHRTLLISRFSFAGTEPRGDSSTLSNSTHATYGIYRKGLLTPTAAQLKRRPLRIKYFLKSNKT